jgi:hypothetical protein
MDPATGRRTWAHGNTGRRYVPQSLRGYLLGRALDIVLVVGAVWALAKGASLLLHSAGLMLQEWQSVASVGLLLFAIVFLYGGVAGTVGTLGEAATRMRVVSIADGSVPGFLAGGLRAVGWVLHAALTLLLSDTGQADTKYVAVRRGAGAYKNHAPVHAPAA